MSTTYSDQFLNQTNPNDRTAIQKPTVSGYEDITIGKLISRTKTPVYIAFSPNKNCHYALKVFGFFDKQPNSHFQNESRFAFVNHINVIKMLYAEEKIPIILNNVQRHISCILMEYAPYGDFYSFLRYHSSKIHEKLVRTYFHQLIEGIEQLHDLKIWHLDIKLENLLIGKDFQLKIADFDLSFINGDSRMLSRGTRFFRAPEIKASICKDGAAADIYSAGIILFILKTGGIIPNFEDDTGEGRNLLTLVSTNNEEFFRIQSDYQNLDASFFDKDFKELFSSMMKVNPNRRATIRDIKTSKWYKGPVYGKEELSERMKVIFKE